MSIHRWFTDDESLTASLAALTAAIASFITSKFFFGTVPSSYNFNLSSTWSFSFSPKIVFGVSEKASILDAIVHLLAKNREIRPEIDVRVPRTRTNGCPNYSKFTITLVFGSGTSNECRVEQKTILWSISSCLESSEKSFFSTQDLDGRCGIFSQFGQWTSVRDQSSTNNITNKWCKWWSNSSHFIGEITLELFTIICQTKNLIISSKPYDENSLTEYGNLIRAPQDVDDHALLDLWVPRSRPYGHWGRPPGTRNLRSSPRNKEFE